MNRVTIQMKVPDDQVSAVLAVMRKLTDAFPEHESLVCVENNEGGTWHLGAGGMEDDLDG